MTDYISDPPAELLSCSFPNCSAHASLLDDYSEHIVSTMFHCFPCKRPSLKRVPGWKDSAGQLRRASIFWHRVWEEAGYPSVHQVYYLPLKDSRAKLYEGRLSRANKSIDPIYGLCACIDNIIIIIIIIIADIHTNNYIDAI